AISGPIRVNSTLNFHSHSPFPPSASLRPHEITTLHDQEIIRVRNRHHLINRLYTVTPSASLRRTK
ncbi:hypothetical protein J6590_107990, partial [Homalodisca vitripennis]